MTLEEWEQAKDRELEGQLAALFRSSQPPAPPEGFVSRTMKAVRQAPVPDGRQPLRRPWIVLIGWATLVSAAAARLYGALGNQRLVAEVLSSFIALGTRAGMQLVRSMHTSSMVLELLATTSRVIAHAMSTREATSGLALMAIVAAVSLSLLNKLLFSEKESSSW